MNYIIDICLLGGTKCCFCSICNHLMLKSHSNIWSFCWTIVILMIWNIGMWFSLLMVAAGSNKSWFKPIENFLTVKYETEYQKLARVMKYYHNFEVNYFLLNLTKAFWYFFSFCLNIHYFRNPLQSNTAYALGKPVWNKHIFRT